MLRKFTRIPLCFHNCPCSIWFCLFFFLGPHPWRMEVPKLGVKSDPQPPAIATATATPDPSYATACSNSGSLIHWMRRGIESASSWILVKYIACWATAGTPSVCFVGSFSHQHFPGGTGRAQTPQLEGLQGSNSPNTECRLNFAFFFSFRNFFITQFYYIYSCTTIITTKL